MTRYWGDEDEPDPNQDPLWTYIVFFCLLIVVGLIVFVLV